MRRINLLYLLLLISFFVSSCEFSCSVGNKEETIDPPQKTFQTPVHQDGAVVYNGIDLKTSGIKLKKAYLVTKDGEKVPDDNFIDFKQPVKLLLIIDSGWHVTDKKVKLTASERVLSENGDMILNKTDLFESMPDGVDAEDAKIIGLTVTLSLKEGSPPTFFTIHFRVSDKVGYGFIEGSYKLYSK